MKPEDLKFTSTHEWVAISGDTATIGISDHAQKELGDIVFIEMPEIGKNLTTQEEFGTIESTKAASQLYAPLSGKVIEINKELSQSPELVNKDPYGKGWIIKITISNPDETRDLLDFTLYSSTLK